MTNSVIRDCLACGAHNRVPVKHLADAGRCGTCKAGLPPLDEPLDVDAGTFEEIVRASRVPVLVDFWAAWCMPCQVAAPEVHELAIEMAGRALVLKVDTDSHPELGARFGVRSIPNFVVLKDGRPIHQSAGLAPRAVMRRWLEQAA